MTRGVGAFDKKWRRTCPTCKKLLKYEDPFLMRHWLVAELKQTTGIRLRRHDIIAHAVCCDSGWVKLRGQI
jgi:hypothetical protein